MCKAWVAEGRASMDFDRGLHRKLRLSTAFRAGSVQTVGNAERDWPLCANLPAYHSGGVRFSKTGTAFAPALCVVSGRLSTFPATTATTAKKNFLFMLFRSRIVLGIHRINRRPILTPFGVV